MINLRKKFNKTPLQIRTRADLYGVSEEFILNLYAEQDGKCAICECSITLQSRKPNTAQLDHCHHTGNVRGFLCSQCNMALGRFKDDKEYILKAYKYLNKE